MGKGARPGTAAPAPAAAPATDARLLEAVLLRFGNLGNDPLDLARLHASLDALAEFTARPETMEVLRRVQSGELDASNDADALAELVVQIDRLYSELEPLEQTINNDLGWLTGLRYHLSSRGWSVRERLERVQAERLARQFKSQMADSVPFTDLISGALPLPDAFPLTDIPLVTRSGNPLQLSSWMSLYEPQTRTWLRPKTYGELRAILDRGVSFSTTPAGVADVPVRYVRANRSASLPASDILIIRRELAVRVTAFVQTPATTPAATP